MASAFPSYSECRKMYAPEGDLEYVFTGEEEKKNTQESDNGIKQLKMKPT